MILKGLEQKLCWLRGTTTGPVSCPMSCKYLTFKKNVSNFPSHILISASKVNGYVYDNSELLLLLLLQILVESFTQDLCLVCV